MAADRDLSFTSILDAGTRMRDGELSPVALVEHCLERIEAFNPRLNAFITVTAELAREQARQAEREIRAGHWRGALHGIPVAVKDFYDTAGIRTTAASAELKDRIPVQDAELVVKLRDAGAVLVGKTNMHMLGMGTTSLDSYFGPVVNPRSATHVAGGSSGGSAAAVAAGLCFATVDTDAVGSGRLPAAICGVTAHKPTFGILSTAGILAGEKPPDPAIQWLSHPCLTARSADDVALVFEALTTLSTKGATSARLSSPESPSIRRLGVVANFAATADLKAAFNVAVSTVAAMGFEMAELSAPFEEASFDMSRIENDRAAINESMFSNVGAIMLPTLASPTPTIDVARAQGPLAVSPNNTFFCNYFGLPAISIPNGFDKAGLPLGLQFVGPQGGDVQVIALARAFQHATDWRYSPPTGAV